MEPAVAAAGTPKSPVFQDGLGKRRRFTDPTGSATLEILCLDAELTAVPSFEFALRERVSRLANFHHPYFAYVRSVDRLSGGDATLGVTSEATQGARLSDILAGAQAHHLPLDINTALCLIRQLVPAIATFHEHQPDVAHGALAPERVVITPNARLVVVEYAMGAALEQLRYSHQRYWKDLRIALPRSAGLPHFDHRVDVTQIGVVALSLILGRGLAEDDYPARLPELVGSAWAMSARGDLEPLPPGLRTWLMRALQLDLRSAFTTAAEAGAELDKVLASDSDYIADPAAVEKFLARYQTLIAPVAQPAAEAPKAAAPPVTIPVPRKEASEPRREAATPPVDVIPPPSGLTVEPVAASTKRVDPPGRTVAPTAPAPVPAQAPSTPAVAPRTLAPPPAAPVQPPKIAAYTPSYVAAPADDDKEDESQWSDEFVKAPRSYRDVRWLRPVAAVVALGMLAGGGFYAARRYGAANAAGATTGTLIVNTNPRGALLSVDGETRGSTPLTLTVKPGEHTLVLSGPGEPRSISVTVPAGTQVSQYIELAHGAATTGQLQVRTDPPGAPVAIDGISRGTSPTTVSNLAPGEHSVVLGSGAAAVTQLVTIEPGITASLMVPLGMREIGPTPGWISVSSPVDVQLYENGRLLGSSQTDRIMVPAGNHQIDLVNEPLGIRVTRSIQVVPGKVASIAVKPPMGTIALNAIPWAEVWIDGEKVGDTPLGNLQIAIGPHEILFRHPELGEQHHSVTVSLGTPARVSVDLRKK
jgi:hypothetical protein